MVSSLHTKALAEAKKKFLNAEKYNQIAQKKAEAKSCTLTELAEDGILAQVEIDLEAGLGWLEAIRDDLSNANVGV